MLLQIGGAAFTIHFDFTAELERLKGQIAFAIPQIEELRETIHITQFRLKA